MTKIEIDGWVTSRDKHPKTGIPRLCPKCGGKLHKTDASRLCGIIFVYCVNGKLPDKDGFKLKPCMWCDIYEP